MLDQRFSAENFRRIYDLENRRGANLERQFFPSLGVHTDKIRALRDDLQALKAEGAEADPDRVIELREDLTQAKDLKEAEIDRLLDSLAADIRATAFRLDLKKASGPKGKDVFPVLSSPQAFFIMKQLQRNVHRLYKVKQSDRAAISAATKDALSSSFPLEIVRTDISTFYESIDRDRLLLKLDQDQLLSLSSKRFIRQLLDAYQRESGRALGIPRGVGVSAYLAELYIRPFDETVRGLRGLVAYHRYVDDIVAIFARPPSGYSLDYTDQIRQAATERGLALNDAKTKAFSASSQKVRFEYIGYQYERSNGACIVKPSGSKIRKYRVRLQKSFQAYQKERPISERKAGRRLVARIMYLTGNTKLSNSKSHAVTGVYYNNSVANDIRTFQLLDLYLHRKLKAISSVHLRSRLMPFSFCRGFDQRQFHRFSTRKIAVIVGAWADAA